MTKAVWRERWEEVRTLREELESHEVDVPVVIERADRRESSVIGEGTEGSAGKFQDGDARQGSDRKHDEGWRGEGEGSGTQTTSGDKERDQRSNAVMERPARGTIETVPTGRGDDMEVITDPAAVAVECCGFGKRRMGSMQPKLFRRYDVAAEHEVWFSDGTTARSGRVAAIDDDGRRTVVDEEEMELH